MLLRSQLRGVLPAPDGPTSEHRGDFLRPPGLSTSPRTFFDGVLGDRVRQRVSNMHDPRIKCPALLCEYVRSRSSRYGLMRRPSVSFRELFRLPPPELCGPGDELLSVANRLVSRESTRGRESNPTGIGSW